MFSYVFFIALLATYGTYRLIDVAVRAIFNITTERPTQRTTTTTTTPPPTTRMTRPKPRHLRNRRPRPTTASTISTTIKRRKKIHKNTRHPDWHHLTHPHYHPHLLDIQLRKHLHNTTTVTRNPFFWTTSSSTTTRKKRYPTRRTIFRLKKRSTSTTTTITTTMPTFETTKYPGDADYSETTVTEDPETTPGPTEDPSPDE